MQDVQGNLFTRNDTLLGVCEGLGEDLGINPTWLRIAFAVPLIWNPVAAIAAYLAAGVIVLATRLIFPKPRAVPAEGRQDEAFAGAAVDAGAAELTPALPLAA